MRNFRLKLTIYTLLGVLALSRPALAFNQDYLMPDYELERGDSMNLADIQRFLERKGTLGYQYFTDTDGITRTAAEIIWRVATGNRISPKFLLALMQREQSLVEDQLPTQGQFDWAMGYGVCDDCSTAETSVARFRGFGKQVSGAARQLREGYIPDILTNGKTSAGFGPGITKLVDGTPVTPANMATAILYTYTPHLHGNVNFASIWDRWFSKTHPDGTIVTADNRVFWFIQNSIRRRFASISALASRTDLDEVVPISSSDLEKYDEGKPIRFANYSLLRATDGGIFLLVDDARRPIISMKVFRTLGFNADELVDVTDEDLASYPEGEAITLESAYPQGGLLQDKISGGVYWVQDGVKYPIWSKEIMNINFGSHPITQISSEELTHYRTGEPIRFRDGTLVGAKGSPTVYVISNGERRPISSESVFNSYGWKWNNIVWTLDGAVNLHPLGEPVLLTGDLETATNP